MRKIITILMIIMLLLTQQSFAKATKKSHKSAGIYSIPAKISPPGQRVFVFSPRYLKWGAYDAQGNRLSHGLANGGNHYCKDVHRSCLTPVGTFRVNFKGAYSCKSTRFPIKRTKKGVVRGGAPMPYCMFFTSNYAIHGSPQLGHSNSSHGCIRVSYSAAKWLSHNFINIGTKVRVLPY